MSFIIKYRKPIVESLFAILVGFLGGAVLMVIFGYDPIGAYTALLRGSIISLDGILESLANAVPLMLTGLTFAIGVRSGYFNIGAEGQAYMGAIGAVVIGGAIALPPLVHLITATVFAMLIGAAWSLPVSALKAYRGVHEVVSTIMLNWIALFFVRYLIEYYYYEPGRAERALPTLPTARYDVIGASLTTIIFISIGFIAFTYFLLWRTTLGYELRLTGSNPEAARYVGINSTKVIFLNFFIGGLAAGLAGASQVIGRPPAWTIYKTLGNVINLGFNGIGVALIGRNHPFGIIFSAIFLGVLLHGARFMQYQGIDPELTVAINGIIVIALSIPELYAMIKKSIVGGKAR
ncbi:MAG: ABC transporter permease [Sulfolobales archaeon]